MYGFDHFKIPLLIVGNKYDHEDSVNMEENYRYIDKIILNYK